MTIQSECNAHTVYAQEHCVDNLPTFEDQGRHSRSLLLGIQALIPKYQFTCKGRVINWGLATEKRGRHRVDLQVWRPVEEADGSYDLIGANSFDVQPEKGQKLILLTPTAAEQIQVQAGDVLGLFIENNLSIGDDYLIQVASNTPGITVHFTETDHPLVRIEQHLLPVQQNVAPVVALEMGKYVRCARHRQLLFHS